MAPLATNSSILVSSLYRMVPLDDVHGTILFISMKKLVCVGDFFTLLIKNICYCLLAWNDFYIMDMLVLLMDSIVNTFCKKKLVHIDTRTYIGKYFFFLKMAHTSSKCLSAICLLWNPAFIREALFYQTIGVGPRNKVIHYTGI